MSDTKAKKKKPTRKMKRRARKEFCRRPYWFRNTPAAWIYVRMDPARDSGVISLAEVTKERGHWWLTLPGALVPATSYEDFAEAVEAAEVMFVEKQPD